MTDSISGLTNSRIHCLLFDLGNTLWQRTSYDQIAPLEFAADQHAIHLLRQAYPSFSILKENDEESALVLRRTLLTQFALTIEKDPLTEPEGATIVQQALKALGVPEADLAFCQTIFDTMQINLAQARVLFEDALATLDELQQRHFQFGVVTNRYWGGKSFHEDMRTMGLLKYFDLDTVMASADLHIRKPNPAIFQLALQACNTTAETSIMIGDSLVSDVAGAQQLGIVAVWKPYNYAEIASYLAENEGISVAEYNRAQLLLLREQGIVAPSSDYLRRDGVTYLEHFSKKHIRPQLIINHLSELLEWI
ncbi:hypothetical protein KSC_099570 [Ktedonobacter sp. SOSP1-52]|uniref:HAD family hydrolase n=1 Tax=Ktedonobacter sp. SOSP1-52 TaxID=2778366 RepID=UPI0019159762|nr:HAD family hydrolase [Ktedonobacter sp. SOSP1-52]GHO71065.1 hypothetical protein KSC_099570 [Ktedonobacter sp. SOSP1-52]